MCQVRHFCTLKNRDILTTNSLTKKKKSLLTVFLCNFTESERTRLEICCKVEMLLRCQRRMTIAFCCVAWWKNQNVIKFFDGKNFLPRFWHCIISDGLERMKRFICHHLSWVHRLIKIPFQQNDYVYLSPFPHLSCSKFSVIYFLITTLLVLRLGACWTCYKAKRTSSFDHRNYLFRILCSSFVFRIYNYALKSHWHLKYLSSKGPAKVLWIVLWSVRQEMPSLIRNH